jgi:hypothetical protein
MASFLPISSPGPSRSGAARASRALIARRIRKARGRAVHLGHSEGIALGIGHGLEALSRESNQIAAEIQSATAIHLWDLSRRVIEELLTCMPEVVQSTLVNQIARVTEELTHLGSTQIALHPSDIGYLESVQAVPRQTVSNQNLQVGTAEIRIGTATISLNWRDHLKRLHQANSDKIIGNRYTPQQRP